LADGNIYGFLVKNRGFAVNELVTPGEDVVKTNNVFLRKVKVTNLKCRVDEIITLSQKNGNELQTDVAGSVLQIDKIKDKEGKYNGTVLSDLQLYLAELSLTLNIPLGKNNIPLDTIEWSKSGNSIEELLEKGYFYKTGTDSMGHLNKGAFSYRFDALNNLILDKCSFNNIKNYSYLGNEIINSKKPDLIKRKGYPGTDTLGINLSFCSDVSIRKFNGIKLFSKNGNSISVNIIFGCKNIKLDEIKIVNIKAGILYKNKWLGESYLRKKVDYENIQADKTPIAIGIKYENGSIIDMKDIEIYDLNSYREYKKLDKIQ